MRLALTMKERFHFSIILHDSHSVHTLYSPVTFQQGSVIERYIVSAPSEWK